MREVGETNGAVCVPQLRAQFDGAVKSASPLTTAECCLRQIHVRTGQQLYEIRQVQDTRH